VKKNHQARDDWISERVFSLRHAVRMPQHIDAVRLYLFVSCPAAGRAALAQYPPPKKQLPRVAQALIDAITAWGSRALLPMPVRALGGDAERDARRFFE
jgi:hypothetical protein